MKPNNKYIYLLLGSFVAMALFASCQEQKSTATTTQPAATKTKSTQFRTTQGGMQRTRTVPATPTPTP